MKILLLSDLHLGSNLFKESARQKVIQLLRSKEFDEIMLLGDVYDRWERSLESICNEYSDIISIINQRAKEIPIYFTVGNHDPDIEELNKIHPNIEIDKIFWTRRLNDKLTVFLHGEDYDPTIIGVGGTLLFGIYWILSKAGINGRAILRWIMQSYKKHDNTIVLKTERRVLTYYHKYDYVVMGHTHFPKIVPTDNATYINVGDWIDNNCYCVYENNDFKLIYV